MHHLSNRVGRGGAGRFRTSRSIHSINLSHVSSADHDTRLERPRAAVGGTAAPAAPSAELDPPRQRIRSGDRIDRYVVEKRLGAGGMGIVYLARDPDLERLVAIKLVRPGLSTGRVRLLREGQA